MKQQHIPIVSATPGMRLATAVSDDAGRTLVPAGTTLTGMLLDSLVRRGVAELCVEDPAESDPAAAAACVANIGQSVDRLFRVAGDAPATLALRQAIVAFRMERGQ